MAAKRPTQPSGLLTIGALALSGIGFGTSVYLTDLYVQATEALSGGAEVDSFCNISKGVNCATVAASEYSAFLGVPISVWGLEFFGLSIALVLASRFKIVPLKRWDSLLFVLSGMGVPVTIILGWISVNIIQSVCILCVTVYAVNTLMFAMFAIPNRKRLGAHLVQGPRELWNYAMETKHRVGTVIAVLLALSQFYWVPQVMGRDAQAAGRVVAPSTDVSDAKPGMWMELPASRNTLGPVNAPIRIEEFTDFQCPFCGRAHEVMLEVVRKYPGKIHLVHRDFPLDNNCNPSIQERFHPDACGAAFFAQCAAAQDLYWPFESMLFHNQNKLKKAAMLSFAKDVGLDTDRMASCVTAKSTHEAVLADIKEGLERGISGTPTLFVNGETIVGAKPLEFWDQKIQSLLGVEPPASSSPTESADAAPPAPASAPSPLESGTFTELPLR